jgi:hypothetical protein
MKHFGDLNEMEHLKLAAAMARLKEEALRYSLAQRHQHSELAYAARAFSDTLDEIGLSEYYREANVIAPREAT